MIYLKASVKGTAEKAIAGMFFDGTMYDEAIKELTCRFGNPGLISKSLISKLLEMPTLKDESTSSLRSFVDTLHNLVRTLKTYGHGADLKAAANMQHVMGKLPPAISERWSRSGPKNRKTLLTTRSQLQGPKQNVPFAKETMGSPCVKRGRRQL